jgi:Tfp pilus assembly protein PilO
MKFILPLIFLIAAVAVFLGYTNPLYQNIKTEQVTASQISGANQKAAQLRAVRDTLTQERNNISDTDIDRLQKLLPDAVDNIGLIIDMNNIAAQYGMSIKDVRINQGSTDKGTSVGPDSNKYGTISMSFVVSTTYENFIAFLQELEASLRLVDVTSVSFSASKNGIYDYNVNIQTYWLK